MAYLDLNAVHPFHAGVIGEVRSEPRLTPQERLVVLLSRKDPLWSLRPASGHSKLLRLIFGIEAPHRLADMRLEALRRYAVTYRLRAAEIEEAGLVANAAGFSASQLGQVRQMIDGGARTARSRPGRSALLGRPLLALAGLFMLYRFAAWLAPRFDSGLLAFVVAAVALVSFAPFLGQTDRRGQTY